MGEEACELDHQPTGWDCQMDGLDHPAVFSDFAEAKE